MNSPRIGCHCIQNKGKQEPLFTMQNIGVLQPEESNDPDTCTLSSCTEQIGVDKWFDLAI